MRETSARTRHFRDFYTAGGARSDDPRPLWLIVGNCQAEALRLVLDGVPDRPYATVRIPPVHELTEADLPALRHLLGRADVLLCQPIRAGYRDLPLGTAELAAELPSTARVIRWPVIRYAGLHPFQAIVRNPADRSVVPPVVPYHDLRTIVAARDGHSESDEWDVAVPAAGFVAVADASVAELARREVLQCDVGISNALTSFGVDAAHTINHPGNRVLTELGRRILGLLDVDLPVTEPPTTLLNSVVAPLQPRVLEALHLDAPERGSWTSNGTEIRPEDVHRAQLRWYRQNPDYVPLALARHASTLELLGLGSPRAA